MESYNYFYFNYGHIISDSSKMNLTKERQKCCFELNETDLYLGLKNANIDINENALFRLNNTGSKFEYEARFYILVDNLTADNQVSINFQENIRVTMGGASYMNVYSP